MSIPQATSSLMIMKKSIKNSHRSSWLKKELNSCR